MSKHVITRAQVRDFKAADYARKARNADDTELRRLCVAALHEGQLEERANYVDEIRALQTALDEARGQAECNEAHAAHLEDRLREARRVLRRVEASACFSPHPEQWWLSDEELTEIHNACGGK